jgi:hypothetical protein
MNINMTSLSYATYWRLSLADADLGKGALRNKDIEGFRRGSREELKNGRLGAELVKEFFKGEADDVETVDVTIYPYVYRGRFEHGKRRATGVPEIVAPIVSQAYVDRYGKIYPTPNTVVPRDILEPLGRGSFSIGTVTDLDTWLQGHQVPDFDGQTVGEQDPDAWHAARWAKYIDYFKNMRDAVTCGWPNNTESFDEDDQWLIIKNDSVIGASRHILDLYDHQREVKPSVPLFDRYASESVMEPEPCLPSNAGFSLRLGHASDMYPLSDAQRDALTHQLVSGHGEILGINGPPGTGKTTLVLSVVASYWVQAALNGAEPPVIAAASTNNQAVTNIIDSFAKDFSRGKGPLAGRWLPKIKSFGVYFPSETKKKQVAGKYQTKEFFDSVEDADYIKIAEEAYLKAASIAFPDMVKPTVQSVVEELNKEIRSEYNKLVAMEKAWASLQNAKQILFGELGDTPEAALAARKQALVDTGRRVADFGTLLRAWELFLARESLIYTLFSWFPPVARKRMLVVKNFLKSIWPTEYPNTTWASVEAISTHIENLFNSHKVALDDRQRAVQTAEDKIKAVKDAMLGWEAAIAPVSRGRSPGGLSLANCDPAADIEIRFPAFLLATHYWEGKWLLEVQRMLPRDLVNEKNKNGRKVLEKRWRRRMKLTPCVVSTFYMLPNEMKCTRYNSGEFFPEYLYDFVDLLIVDEAGQVLPEVAGASFALAKRAMVIGDTFQLEPIWNIKPHVDIGNLLSAGIISIDTIDEHYNRLRRLGKTAASGSVMEIAQAATRYYYDRELVRGMFLYEHRRCYDEIVAFCNALCYRNKLKPMRGKGTGMGVFPAMGYLHINGICERRNGGSRQNELEADTIAAWIVHHKNELEQCYGKGVDEIVGVVTPFGGQVAAITEACRSLGLHVGKKAGEMTVGTVHSLQGAERPVVIFSPTYSIHEDGHFMDRSPSMLNVAVSRAKDAFLVFGDMDVFNPNDKGRPRGLLASFLFSEETNALAFKPLPRKDMVERERDVAYLIDATQHDAFLLDSLEKAVREVHIVSPWIRQQRMKDSGILSAMAEAALRGVSITVYADRELNLDREGDANQEAEGNWLDAMTVFADAGITLVDIPRLHSKIVIRDNVALCVGSFNWLSASRRGRYVRHETSITYTGPRVGQEIGTILRSLASRVETIPFSGMDTLRQFQG